MKYSPRGILALDSQAIGQEFNAPINGSPTNVAGVAVVRVCGPLDHHKSDYLDSYEALAARVDLACGLPVQHIVLVIDSPGGLVSGLFETASLIKARCAAAGKTLTAFVEGAACSAAYGLACIANRVCTSSTGIVGSIGVIDVRVDVSSMDEAQGIKVALITSGERKGDGHPNLALSAEELADRQRVVDGLASVFFKHVSASRGLSTEAIKSLQARVYPGQAAVDVGLADQVCTLNELISALTSANNGVAMSDFDAARAALEKAAESENEEEAKKAKKALAALSAEESEEDKPQDDEDEDEKPAAESEDETKPEASAVSATTAGDLAATVQSLSAQIAQLTSLHETSEKAAYLASRQDLGKDLIKVLESKPLAEVKQIVSAIPRKGATLAATAVVPATRGATNGASSAPASETDRMDQIMGVRPMASTGVTRTEHTLVLGAPQARKGA